MAYYLMVENNEIIGKSQCLSGRDVIDVEVSEEVYNDYEQEKYLYQDGEIVENPDWENILLERLQEENRQRIIGLIEELDKKRIRAMCEPSVRNHVTGETWLEYYNDRIAELRTQL